MKLSKEYLAGFLDADGSICITKSQPINRNPNHIRNPNHMLLVNFVSSNKKILITIARTYGKSVHKYSKSTNKLAKKKLFQWGLTASNALKFLEDLLPFLIIKKEQAKLGIEFQKYKNKNNINMYRENGRFPKKATNKIKKIRKKRENMRLMMQKLNRF